MPQLRALTMPKWGIEMTEGTLAGWSVQPGQSFAKGDVLALIETDKITNEVDAEFPATLARVLVEEGETVSVGTMLAVFSEGDASADEVDAFLSGQGVTVAPRSIEAPAPATTSTDAAPANTAPRITVPADLAISPAARERAMDRNVDPATIAGSGRNGRVTLQDVDQALTGPASIGTGDSVDITVKTGQYDHVYASPLAKRLAVTHGIELGNVKGTGARGRICKADVLERVAISEPPAAEQESPAPRPQAAVASSADGDREVVPMSAMRKAIARQLTLSKSTIPHFYLRNAARVDALMAMREAAKRATGAAPSVNDYLLRAVALALQSHRDVNVQVHGDEIHRFADSDIAIAVATDKGLITPILRAAQTKSVAAIAAESKALAARAREGRLTADEFRGGSFSLSNLGMFGIAQFDAIINPPQGAILAVGAVQNETFHVDHALVHAKRIHLSLSCDHRAIDGAVGARFLAELTRLIESPAELTA